MAQRHTNCIVFLTHVWSPPIARHFERLKREASPFADVFLAFHAARPLPDGVPADIVVTDDQVSRLMPARYAKCREDKRDLYTYIDLVFLAAFSDPVVSTYDHFWYVEMDVDYSGDWGSFFSEAVHYEGDFLAQSIVPGSMLPRFDHWDWYEQPEEVTIEPLRAFMCISRFSRRMVELLIEEHNTRPWGGIFELTHPTIAALHHMQIAQIGGTGPFTPPERRGRHYNGRTFTFRPPRAYDYFCDAPQRFRYRDRLYHPVKVGWPISRRINETWQGALRRWSEHSPPMRKILSAVGLYRRPPVGLPSFKQEEA